MALGLDPDQYFQKDKFSRMLIVGGYIADSAISSMRSHDIAEDRARKAEAESKRKHRK